MTRCEGGMHVNAEIIYVNLLKSSLLVLMLDKKAMITIPGCRSGTIFRLSPFTGSHRMLRQWEYSNPATGKRGVAREPATRTDLM